MKKLLTLLGLLLILSPMYSQVDNDDEQLFGSVRGEKYYALKNIQKIAGNETSHTFTIKNEDAYNMNIISVNIPKGTSVLVPQNIILSKEAGKIIVTVYKEYIEKDNDGMFLKEIGVNVREESLNGVIIHKTYTLKLTGQFVK